MPRPAPPWRRRTRRCPACSASVSFGSSVGKRACSASISPRSTAEARPLGGQPELHPRPGQRRGQVDGIERLPGLVVVGSDRVGDAPARDREVGIEFQCAVEAADGLFVVERVGPDHPAVEPHLRLRRRCLNRPVIGPQVVVRLGLALHHRGGNAHRWHDNSAGRRRWRLLRAHSRPHPRSPA